MKRVNYKHLSKVILKVLFLLIYLFVLGCESRQKDNKQLLVYCGITMIKPMHEIAKIIEKKYNCRIIITKGGSGNLLKSIKINKVGDLYLPGSEGYIKTSIKEGLVSETIFVGYNKAALMVQKGNPKRITADLNNLLNKKYYVVIGNPNSGSIGKETKAILKKKGIFKRVMNNAKHYTTDSKDLVFVLKERTADLVVNWYATSQWKENKNYVDVLNIDNRYAEKKRLIIGLLKSSKYKDIARAFMKLASSKQGNKIFDKYGLYNIK